MVDRARAPRGRCLLVWLSGTALLTGLALTMGRLLLQDLTAVGDLLRHGPADGMTLEQLLTHVAGVVLLGSLLWLWVIGSAAVMEAATGRTRRSGPVAPAVVRHWVLAACGVGLVVQAGPAMAVAPDPGSGPGDAASVSQRAGELTGQLSGGGPGDPSGVLAGLPLPDRAESPPRRATPPTTEAPQQPAHEIPGHTVVVTAGQTLWSLAAQRLPDTATDAQIAHAWREIHAANRSTIGDNPDLIHPGTRLRLPAELDRTHREDQR